MNVTNMNSENKENLIYGDEISDVYITIHNAIDKNKDALWFKFS